MDGPSPDALLLKTGRGVQKQEKFLVNHLENEFSQNFLLESSWPAWTCYWRPHVSLFITPSSLKDHTVTRDRLAKTADNSSKWLPSSAHTPWLRATNTAQLRCFLKARTLFIRKESGQQKKKKKKGGGGRWMFKQFVKVRNLNWTAVVNTKLPIFNLTKSQLTKQKNTFFP